MFLGLHFRVTVLTWFWFVYCCLLPVDCARFEDPQMLLDEGMYFNLFAASSFLGNRHPIFLYFPFHFLTNIEM